MNIWFQGMGNRRIVLLTLLLGGLLSSAHAAQTRDPYSHFFGDTFGNFKEELDLAREEGKKAILVFFEQDDCPFCHRMKQTVLNQPEVQDYYREHFHIFALDIEGDVEIVDFDGKAKTQKEWAFKDNGVRATPVFAFFDLAGNRIVRYTGATSGPEEFLWLGEFVAEGHYTDTNFTRYKREKRKRSTP